MSLQTASDVPLLISSSHTSSEKRITPSWSITHLKTRLEPITGIPASAQRLALKVGSQEPITVGASDEDATTLSSFPLQAYAELIIHDTRPAAARTDYTDVSAVQKFVMPESDYETRSDSVLAWKKAAKLGRFDPEAPGLEQQKILSLEREIEERGITTGGRCRLLPATVLRHGTIRHVGTVKEIPGSGPWVGIELDEPTGKNDGAVAGARYFTCGRNCGVFVRPERVENGDFPVVGIDEGDEMEEI